MFFALQADDWFVRLFGLPIQELDDTTRSRNSMKGNGIAFIISNLVAYLINIHWVFNGLSVDSWYKYHRNRFKGLLRHNYRWTDEKIVATAATEAFVCRKRVIIVTQDSDFHAIFWQFSNNFVMFKLLRRIRDQQISPSEFWRQFSELCEAYNSFYLKMIEQRSQAAISELHAKNKGIHPVIVNLRATTTKDIAVHYQARKIVDVFIYPEEMIQEFLNAAGIIRNA